MTEAGARLFVALNTAPWEWFRDGKKTWELRRMRGAFNKKNVRVGRRVELRRGYSTPDSLWGVISEVRTFDTLGDAITAIGDGVIPDDEAHSDDGKFNYAAEFVGFSGPFLAFRPRLSILFKPEDSP